MNKETEKMHSANIVLNNLSYNLDMFMRLPSSDHTSMMIDKISKEINCLIDYMDGKVEFKELPIDVQTRFYSVPDWFTKGT